jgi:hypothetical protein
MARYILTSQSVTAGLGSADAATITTSFFYASTSAATMSARINEVQAGGEATAGSVQVLVLARDSTNAATPTAGAARLVLADVMATAPATVVTFGQTATTLPTRSANHLLQHSFNAYGGLVRWQARQGEEITFATATAGSSEVSYSAYTGSTATGTISSHMIFEQV